MKFVAKIPAAGSTSWIPTTWLRTAEPRAEETPFLHECSPTLFRKRTSGSYDLSREPQEILIPFFPAHDLGTIFLAKTMASYGYVISQLNPKYCTFWKLSFSPTGLKWYLWGQGLNLIYCCLPRAWTNFLRNTMWSKYMYLDLSEFFQKLYLLLLNR